MQDYKEQKKQWLAAMGLDVERIPQARQDWREITHGWEIPSAGYADQPYVVQADDGAWVCVMTTGKGAEGQQGQYVCVTRSEDQGRTWSEPIALESPDGVEASYAVMLKAPTGRLYCFYNHNTDNMREVQADPGTFRDSMCSRVDSLGYFVFKYSDDHGKTWSDNRYPIDVREMEIDRNNVYGGKVRFFWNVGKPFIDEGNAFVSLHKVGGFGEGFFTKNEGVLLKSDNMLTETDPEKIRFETLPDGDIGLRTPPGGGPISSEHSYSVMSDGSFFVVYRCVDGHPVCAYSRDKGHHWSEPEYMTYTIGGKKLKHPRAANFAWRCSNGKYLYWFHNHGGKNYEDRNPVWICCGTEVQAPDGLRIEWSLPEIVLYDDDPFIRMSYPDMVEQGGRIYLTETQKHTARVHEVDDGFLQTLFASRDAAQYSENGLILSLDQRACAQGQAALPALPVFAVRDVYSPSYNGMNMRAGVSLDLWFTLDALEPGGVLLDNRDENEIGFVVTVEDQARVGVEIHDGRTRCRWLSDMNVISTGASQHVVIVIDGGPRIITFVVNGDFCDGGDQRQFGWGRFNPHLQSLSGADQMRIGPRLSGAVHAVRIYDRALMSNEAAAHYRAGL